MIEVFYRYRVHRSQVRAFEHAFGPTGPWTQLFSQHPGFIRTRLFRHRDDVSTYLTIDVWEDKPVWDAFRAAQARAYAELDRRLRLLYLEELLLGYYEGTEQYALPADSKRGGDR